MRSEAEMYKLLTDIANADDRILAVYMNGSMTNANVPKDIFQDYDIVYVVPETTDEDYYVKRPTEAQFQACANEFWWCSNNIAKGLWRGEMPYVQDMTNFVVRKQLEKMLSCKVGIKTGFQVRVGKSAKYLYRWLDEKEYRDYLRTYFGGDIEDAWRAVFVMCDLFDTQAQYVAEHLAYTYDKKEGEAAAAFLRHVRDLPKDAEGVW